MTTCRTIAEVIAAGLADGANDPPLTQDQADLIAVILAGTGRPDPVASPAATAPPTEEHSGA